MRDIDYAVSGTLRFAAEFLIEEVLGGLQEMRFGGAFEIGTITRDGAEKVGDFLNLFWPYNKSQTKQSINPVMIKSDYIGDDLIIQRLVIRSLSRRASLWISSGICGSWVSANSRANSIFRSISWRVTVTTYHRA